jgi:hypothetical protein
MTATSKSVRFLTVASSHASKAEALGFCRIGLSPGPASL